MDSKEFDTIVRYSRLQEQKQEGFFDVEEFSTIITHFISRYEIAKAQTALQQGLAQHPGSIELSMNKAYLCLCNGNPDAYIKILGSLELLNPNNEDILCMKAEAYGHRGDAAKGIRILEGHLRATNELNSPVLIVQLAELYMLEGRYLDAISTWKNLLQIEPRREDGLVALLHCFKEADIIEEGLRYYRSIIDSDPYNGLAWVQVGECYASLYKYENAVEAYDYALAIDDDNLIALYNKADSQFQDSKFAEAHSTYMELNLLTPKEAPVLCGIGESLEQLGEHLTAKNYFQQSITCDPHYTDARLGMAICHEHLGDREIALREMETVVALQPDNGEYWYIYAELMSKAELWDKGQLAFERAIQLSDAEPEYIYSQLDSLIDAKEWQSALEKVQSAFEVVGDVPDLYYRGIKALHLLGQTDEAIVLLQMLLERHAQFKTLSDYYPDIFEEPEARELLNCS